MLGTPWCTTGLSLSQLGPRQLRNLTAAEPASGAQHGAPGLAGAGEHALEAQEGALLALALGLEEVHPPLGLHPAHEQQLHCQQRACSHTHTARCQPTLGSSQTPETGLVIAVASGQGEHGADEVGAY